MEQETPSPEYVEGFNQGYLLAKHHPELAAALDKIEKTDQRLEGFADGRKEFYLEKGKDLIPGWLKPDARGHSTDKTKDHDKDAR